ncbi:ABC transporter permease [Loktanella sp. Alg231-35]|uniref:ABC transporter permease n=1 Tax=Loktanella sp. Alg231-35 TaxID=1922220 RepID=UPI000D55D8E6|nr:ABC transporter permease [Loktanella sp. Alg231-35]
MTDATGPIVAADGRPLKVSLNRALRREKLRAFLLILPLLAFVVISFIAPIFDMLFRSVQDDITSRTLPQTVVALNDWDYTGEALPSEQTYEALYYDMFMAAEAKKHTALGSRLNYETTGISSLFRQTGRALDDVGEDVIEAMEDASAAFDDSAFWAGLFLTEDRSAGNNAASTRAWASTVSNQALRLPADVYLSNAAEAALPNAARQYAAFAMFTHTVDEDVPAEEDPWEAVWMALAQDLTAGALTYDGPETADLLAAQTAVAGPMAGFAFTDAFLEQDEDWGDASVWGTIQTFSSPYTAGYFLTAIDLELTPDGAQAVEDDVAIYVTLFWRTMWMSMTITFSCILLGYPIAWLMANLPDRSANLIMILVLLPFWTSLLVRTSAWKVLLQQQGVINDVLVWVGLVGDGSRLALINNATGTIIAMTHILLPFMILPLYSVMKGIPPSYLRAAKSLGATNWTAFWRVYFPQSVPGIGAGSILVFILSIGYYITPEIVGGTKGVFISNRIAYHISSSLNWGLAAALGTILLVVVLALYWAYDRIVGIDNVKLGG